MSQEYLNKLLRGSWTYRSLHDNPDINTPFKDLQFGAGIIEIVEVAYDQIMEGSLDMGGDYKLTMKGEIKRSQGDIEGIYLKGEGIAGTPTEGWVYEYYGKFVYRWENGADQKQVMSGSVIRTVKHGNASAGYVATFYMVKH